MAYLVPTFLALLLGAVLGFALARAMALAVGLVMFALAGLVAALLGGGWGFFAAGIAGPIVALQLSYLAAAAWTVLRSRDGEEPAAHGALPTPAQARHVGRHDAAA